MLLKLVAERFVIATFHFNSFISQVQCLINTSVRTFLEPIHEPATFKLCPQDTYFIILGLTGGFLEQTFPLRVEQSALEAFQSLRKADKG